MKKFKYIIALFAIFICNQTFAGEVDLGTGKIFTDDNYLQYDNGVFLGKKQVDTSIIVRDENGKYFGHSGSTNSSRIDSFINTYDNIVKTNQYDDYSYNNFYKAIASKTSFAQFLYNNSAYYSFNTNINSNIKEITDFNGNEMIYTGSITDSGSSIKLYYKSFLNTKVVKIENSTEGNQYLYYLKYDENYSLKPKNINIIFDNGLILVLNFRFNIPVLVTDNIVIDGSSIFTSHNDSYVQKYMLENGYGGFKYKFSSENNELSNNLMLFSDYGYIYESDYNYSENGKDLFLTGSNGNINLVPYKKYDFNNLTYNYNSVNSEYLINYYGKKDKNQNNGSSWSNIDNFYKDELLGLVFNYQDDYKNGNNFDFCVKFDDNYPTKLETELYKYNSISKNYELYNKKGYNIKTQGACLTYTGVDDGIYKVKIKEIETINQKIFKSLGYNYDIKKLDINDIVIVKNDKAMRLPYDNIDESFFNNNKKNINYGYFYRYKDFFEEFGFKIVTSTGNILFEGNKSDLNNLGYKKDDTEYLTNLQNLIYDIDPSTEYNIQIDYKFYGLPKSKIAKKFNIHATSRDVSKYKSYGKSAWIGDYTKLESIKDPYILTDDYNSSGALLKIELPGLYLDDNRFDYSGKRIKPKYLFSLELTNGTIIDSYKSESCDNKIINNYYYDCKYYDNNYGGWRSLNASILTDISYKNKIKSLNIYLVNPDDSKELKNTYTFENNNSILSKLKSYVLNTIQTSINGFFNNSDYFIDFEDTENILFLRKIVMSKTDDSGLELQNKYKIKLNITGENLTKTDKSKIFICKEDTLTAQDISDGLGGCVNYEDIEKYDIQTEGLFIYALKSAFNTDYKTLNINYDFKIYY